MTIILSSSRNQQFVCNQVQLHTTFIPPSKNKMNLSIKIETTFKIAVIKSDFPLLENNHHTVQLENSFDEMCHKTSLISLRSIHSNDDELPDWEEGDSVVRTLEQVQHFKDECLKNQTRLKKYPIKNLEEFNFLTGSDPIDGLNVSQLRASKLGIFLNSKGYKVLQALRTKGTQSHCFLVKNHLGQQQFLKVFKLKKWDYPSAKTVLYSDLRGDACILNHKFVNVLAPSQLISYSSDKRISTNTKENSVLLAHISKFVFDAVDLNEYMDLGGLSNWYEIRRACNAILKGVISFKEKEISHRDLKPENLIKDFNEESFNIIDFGHAKKERYCHPLDGWYAAPHHESSDKIDEFSLGLLFFLMCTNNRPNSINTLTGKTYREEIMQGNIFFSPDIAVPMDLKKIIKGLLCISPDSRLSAYNALKILDFRPLRLYNRPLA